MKIIYTDAHQAHQPQYEHYDGKPVAYTETAARAEAIITTLRDKPEYRIMSPRHFGLQRILDVHQRQYVDFIRRKQNLPDKTTLYPSYFISDTYAPLTASTYNAARGAVDTALAGAKLLTSGEPAVYCLCRPPGHHAGHHTMGGYCYFNNAAIAAHYLSRRGRVAILDIDFHHGNGSQAAFYDRSDVLYVSLHADPRDRYPYSSGFANEHGEGRGKGYNFNFPLPLGTDDAAYLRHLRQALKTVRDFKPDYLVVSVGFDTFIADPIGGFALTPPVYYQVGELIAGLKPPSLLVQEGGYAVDYLGELVTNFLDGFSSRRGSF